MPQALLHLEVSVSRLRSIHRRSCFHRFRLRNNRFRPAHHRCCCHLCSRCFSSHHRLRNRRLRSAGSTVLGSSLVDLLGQIQRYLRNLCLVRDCHAGIFSLFDGQLRLIDRRHITEIRIVCNPLSLLIYLCDVVVQIIAARKQNSSAL